MKSIYIMIVIAIIVSSGCKGPTGLEGATGSQLKGDIFGYVDVYDVNGKQVADRRGVYVQTEETSTGEQSDSTGRWTLKDRMAGIYTITASKTGYTNSSVAGFQFVGGGNAYLNSTLGIIELPTYSIKSVLVAGKTTDSIGQQLSVDIFPSPLVSETRSFFIVYGKTPGVVINSSDAMVTSQVSYVYKGAGSASFSLKNAINSLKNLGMQSGENVYAVVYPSSAHINNIGIYTDPLTKKTIFTRYSSPFAAVNFQIP